MSPEQRFSQALAASLPWCDKEGVSDLISLCDIVVTGVETEWRHFWVRKYDADASGEDGHEWALIEALPSAEQTPRNKHVALTRETMRAAVEAYLKSRLEAGMTEVEAAKLVDGSYTDAEVADSILQFALYGQEVYS